MFVLRSYKSPVISIVYVNAGTEQTVQCKTAGAMSEAPPKSLDELLATPIGELVGCWIGVRCTTACNRASYLPLKLMAAQHGRVRLLRDVISRLRCQYCKTPPSAMWLVDYPIENSDHGGQAATWRVELNEAVGGS